MPSAQLTQLRRRRGLPATALALRTGIDPSAIYAFEGGRRDPRLSTVRSWARGLGARILVVDTHGRTSAAETAAIIDGHLEAGDHNAAVQSLLQLVNSLRASDTIAVAALTADSPAEHHEGWSWAIAGVVEDESARRGLPVPEWASSISGDPSASWSPWASEVTALVDIDQVPEPLRRRGVLIETGELEAA